MADAEEIAGKALDIVAGLGGAAVGVLGGGSEGAKGVQVGIGAIKDIVGTATGSTARKQAEADEREQKRTQADRELEKRALDLREREIALKEREAQRERDKIRDFDAPMYPPPRRRAAAEARTWAPSELRDGDRIVDLIETDDRVSPPLVDDARQSVILRRGDSADVLLVDGGPLIDGAQAPTSADAGRFPLQVHVRKSPSPPPDGETGNDHINRRLRELNPTGNKGV